MKKLLLIGLSLFICIYTNAQDRISAKTMRFAHKSEAMTIATHWKFNKNTKQWECIPNNNIEYAGRWEGHNRNFISARINIFTIDANSYYVLSIRYNSGYYEYPEIETGWIKCQRVDLYLFDKEDVLKMKNIQSSNDIEARYISSTGEYMQYYSEHESIMALLKNLSYGRSVYPMKIKRTVSNGKDVIRFRFPGSYTENQSEIFQDTYFQDMYFETSYMEYSKIFKIVN